MPEFKELHGFPGPLVPGVTHKGEVIQFCQGKINNAKSNHGSENDLGGYAKYFNFNFYIETSRFNPSFQISSISSDKDFFSVDRDSYILLWELLILLLRQKSAIDGCDIAELLLKDRQDFKQPYMADYDSKYRDKSDSKIHE